jgi:predicted phosphodiesterase
VEAIAELGPDLTMIDRSLLDDAEFEFVVLADTHEMLPSSNASVEMKSRALQTGRIAHALEMITRLNPAFAVHLGDLVQEFPENSGFAESVKRAHTRIEASGVSFHYVAGNHDVGDKPDPTMPTERVTSESLAAFHQHFGISWHSWDHGCWRFIVLNSQIMNSGLSAEEEQRYWFERELQHAGDRQTIVFLHMSPYLVDPSEPSLGHYDNIADPARTWLLNQLGRAKVAYVFAGHSHFQFINRFNETRLFVAPSVSFTRPGFSEMFSSQAPPEQGRNDTNKLGFFLVRVKEDGAKIHFIRTQTRGPQFSDKPSLEYDQLTISRTSKELPGSRLGVVSRHAIAPAGYLPLAWPTLTRQPMRNDYPLFACLDLGVRHLSVPAQDLDDPIQRERLKLLRDEAVGIKATWIWSPELSLEVELASACEVIETAEILMPKSLLPDAKLLRSLTRIRETLGLDVGVAPLMPREIVPGKQHARARIGFRTHELLHLDSHLDRLGAPLDRVTCRVDPGADALETMMSATQVLPLGMVRSIDWLVETVTQQDHEQVVRVVESMVGASASDQCRVFLSPLVDLDRTMDVMFGLLDRQCNPRPAYTTVRLLNSLLWGRGEFGHSPKIVEIENDWSGRTILMQTGSAQDRIWIPRVAEDGPVTLTRTSHDIGRTKRWIRQYDLTSGFSRVIQ